MFYKLLLCELHQIQARTNSMHAQHKSDGIQIKHSQNWNQPKKGISQS